MTLKTAESYMQLMWDFDSAMARRDERDAYRVMARMFAFVRPFEPVDIDRVMHAVRFSAGELYGWNIPIPGASEAV